MRMYFRSSFATRLARGVAATASVLLLASLAACGGASAANTGGSTAASGASGGSGGASGASASNVQMSGAVSGTLKNAANCAKQSDQSTIVITDTVNSKLYLFQIVATHYHGAGTYTTGTTEGEPVVNVNDESDGNNWVSQYSDTPGSIVVNPGEMSGTVHATLVNDSDHSTVTVAGAWACQ